MTISDFQILSYVFLPGNLSAFGYSRIRLLYTYNGSGTCLYKGLGAGFSAGMDIGGSRVTFTHSNFTYYLTIINTGPVIVSGFQHSLPIGSTCLIVKTVQVAPSFRGAQIVIRDIG